MERNDGPGKPFNRTGYLGQSIYRGGNKRKREDEIKFQQLHSANGIPKVMSSVLIKLQKEYFAKWKELITFELEEDVNQIQARLHKWNRSRLISEGVTLFDMEVSIAGKLFTETILKLKRRGNNVPLPHHRFKSGDMVTLCRRNPVEGQIIEGMFAEKTKTWVNVVVQKEQVPADITKGLWRLDMGANRVSFDRMMDALETFISPVIPNGGTDLRDLIVGRVAKENVQTWVAAPPPLAVQEQAKLAGPIDFGAWKVNETQKAVVRSVLGRKLSLIQGPPGTGKTHTAVFILRQWHRLYPSCNIMATADTNTAVDNLLEGLVECGVPCIRIGRPVKVREELREQTLEGKMATHPLAADVQKLRDQLDAVQKAQRGPPPPPPPKGQPYPPRPADQFAELNRRIRELEDKMTADILSVTRVVCATCIGAGHELLANHKFPLVLIDEATQATEPASLCAIVKGSQQLVLLGDHYQLPPTVISDKAEKGGLSRSLFQRLVDEGVQPFLLDIQYRMHPAISGFASRQFYEGKVKDGITANDRPTPAGIPWPKPQFPVAFLNVDSREEKSSEVSRKSKYNTKEAEAALAFFELVVLGGTPAKHAAIITPYNGQVKLLSDMVLRRNLGKVTVSSIDGFQGREKDIIIFTAVRSNAGGKVGFLSDWKRLNVALTRARYGLIVIGNEKTLQNDPHWKAWLDWVKETGLALSLTPEELQAQLQKAKPEKKATEGGKPAGEGKEKQEQGQKEKEEEGKADAEIKDAEAADGEGGEEGENGDGEGAE